MTDIEVKPWPEVQEILPPLTSDRREELQRSIEKYGVKYQVLVLPDGRIIDGHHRWELSGGTAAIEVLDVDEETGFVLAMSLNLFRRDISPKERFSIREMLLHKREIAKKVVAIMRTQGKTQEEVAESLGINRSTVSRIEDEIDVAPGNTFVRVHKGVAKTDKRQRLSDDQEQEVYQRWRGGETQASLAAEFGVAASTISKIFKRLRKREEHRIADEGFPVESDPVIQEEPDQPTREPIMRPFVDPELVKQEVRKRLKEGYDLVLQVKGLRTRFGSAAADGRVGRMLADEVEALASEFAALAADLRSERESEEA